MVSHLPHFLLIKKSIRKQKKKEKQKTREYADRWDFLFFSSSMFFPQIPSVSTNPGDERRRREDIGSNSSRREGDRYPAPAHGHAQVHVFVSRKGNETDAAVHGMHRGATQRLQSDQDGVILAAKQHIKHEATTNSTRTHTPTRPQTISKKRIVQCLLHGAKMSHDIVAGDV